MSFKSKLVKVLMALFIIGALVAFIGTNLAKPRILVLHSYDLDYSWVRDVNVGLNRVLRGKPYNVRWHYMDTKRNPSNDFRERAGLLARRIIGDWKPDLIIAVDDDAQKYAVMYYAVTPSEAKKLAKKPVQIVFVGLNGEPKPYGYDLAMNATGILERKQWTAVKNLIGDAVRPRVPAGREVRIAYVGDSSGSVKEDTKFIDSFDWSPYKLVRSKLVSTYDEWKAEVARANNEADVLLTTNYRRIQETAADAKRMVEPADLVKWTEDNTPKIPVIGTNGFYVEDGGMIAIATSPFEQGEVGARMAVDILDRGRDPKTIPVQSTQEFIVYMRADRVRQNNFPVPRVYESFARAMNNYYGEEP
ncbi:MAG: ABC-type uncharacterized transport system, periplasmic component [Betaproteobacteria bacterium]|nr:ABC-type uncharacterized transport system, periplasmic component [Betaproteobacteria bacterium]